MVLDPIDLGGNLQSFCELENMTVGPKNKEIIHFIFAATEKKSLDYFTSIDRNKT